MCFQDFSLELKPGQMTALVGMSGGGKSTCVSLLERFYQPQQGQILLDGQPLQKYQHKYLHQKVIVKGIFVGKRVYMHAHTDIS